MLKTQVIFSKRKKCLASVLYLIVNVKITGYFVKVNEVFKGTNVPPDKAGQ